ncbi:MAG: hypothetical protein ACR2G4_04720 [Pyrinomonadaceae bacterium]
MRAGISIGFAKDKGLAMYTARARRKFSTFAAPSRASQDTQGFIIE